MSTAQRVSTRSLGADLERDRLERRVIRMTLAIAALRQRASEYRRELGRPPGPLRHAIADFEEQIEAMNARLRDLGPDGTSAHIQRQSVRPK